MDIDSDVLLAAKQLAHERHESMGRVLSELARQALTPKRRSRERNGVPLFSVKPGSRVVTMELVNRLRDEAP